MEGSGIYLFYTFASNNIYGMPCIFIQSEKNLWIFLIVVNMALRIYRELLKVKKIGWVWLADIPFLATNLHEKNKYSWGDLYYKSVNLLQSSNRSYAGLG